MSQSLLRLSVLFVTTLFSVNVSVNAFAASKTELDARVRTAMTDLYERAPEARELANKAAGVLVFPRAIKVGLGFGGKVGEGVLLVNGIPVQYYRLTAGSFGFQLGAQARAEVLMFMTQDALQNFRQSQGWEAGVDGSVALIEFGVGDSVNTNSGRDPIIGFVYGNKGLMYDLSLEGTKYWRINKDGEQSAEVAASGE
jgi:lipid-binding SYLF domain-containing protein